MTDETLVRALGALKAARMDDVASDHVRAELEKSWRERAASRRSGFAVPGFARAFAVAALVVMIAFTTMQAGADSPLYAARVAVEDGLVRFQSDPVAYLTDLYDDRLEEAARFEATGNALAASRAREAKDGALRILKQLTPPSADPSPEPTASTAIFVPTPSPTPEATPEPTPSPTPEPTLAPRTQAPVVRTPAPTVKPTVTPKPPTPKPTVKPSPTPTPTPMQVRATGDVLYADGTPVNGACVSLTGYGANCIAGSINGKIDFHTLAKKGQVLTVYVTNYDASRGGTLKGKVSVTVGGTTVLLGTITLRLP
jgi:hypothetical protein